METFYSNFFNEQQIFCQTQILGQLLLRDFLSSKYSCTYLASGVKSLPQDSVRQGCFEQPGHKERHSLFCFRLLQNIHSCFRLSGSFFLFSIHCYNFPTITHILAKTFLPENRRKFLVRTLLQLGSA